MGVTPSTNVDNLSAVGRWVASTKETPIAFMTIFGVEVMLRKEKKEKEKASPFMINLNLKPPYST